MTAREMREELETLELQGHGTEEVVIALDNNVFPILTVGIKGIYVGEGFNNNQLMLRGSEQITRKEEKR